MFAGELKADAVLAAADDPDAAVKAAHTCEANFYGGEYALIGGNRDEAVKLFGRREGMPARLPRGDRGGGRAEGAGEKAESKLMADQNNGAARCSTLTPVRSQISSAMRLRWQCSTSRS